MFQTSHLRIWPASHVTLHCCSTVLPGMVQVPFGHLSVSVSQALCEAWGVKQTTQWVERDGHRDIKALEYFMFSLGFS